MKFKGLNFKEIKKNQELLESHEGLLPILLSFYCNRINREEFLKEKKILSKVMEECSKRRIEFKKAKDKRKFMDEELLNFVKNNKEFEFVLN